MPTQARDSSIDMCRCIYIPVRDGNKQLESKQRHKFWFVACSKKCALAELEKRKQEGTFEKYDHRADNS